MTKESKRTKNFVFVIALKRTLLKIFCSLVTDFNTHVFGHYELRARRWKIIEEKTTLLIKARYSLITRRFLAERATILSVHTVMCHRLNKVD